MRKLAAAVFLTVLLVLPGMGVEQPLRVLIVHSFGRDFPPFYAVAQGFRAELSVQSPRPVEFFEASLERGHFDTEEKEGPLAEFLVELHRDRAPDLVVAIGAPALFFSQRNLRGIFPDVPLIVIGSDKRRTPELTDNSLITSVHLDLDLQALALNIRQLLPDTQHLYVVMGTAPLERFWEEELRREWPPLMPGVEFHWLSDRSIDDMKSELAAPPARSAIFFGILSRDAAGVPYEHEDALKAIRAVGGAPIFGFSKEQLGQGIVGGPLVEMSEVGRQGAVAAARILAGEDPGNIHVPAVVLRDPVYDWRELKRWRISGSNLMAGSAVAFRPPSVWETQRTLVLGTVAVVVMQTALILLLAAARRRARESELGLRLTAEAAKVGLWEQGRDGADEIRASPEWRGIFGLAQHGPIKIDDVLRCIHPGDLSAVRESIERARTAGLNYDLEYRIVTLDGDVRWIASRGRTEQEPGGRRLRMLGVSMDITERKRAEAEAERRRDELAHLSRVNSLGELSGALAHELNQPLGAILSNAQAALRMLAREPADLGEIREILGDIVSEDRRAGDVIKRLRGLLERGETQLSLVAIPECVEEVLALLRALLIGRGVTVTRAFDSDLPPLMADRVQLQQVFINLIANACDAMDACLPGDRRLILRARAEAGTIHLEVCDTGQGFTGPPERLFEPFHTTKAKGLGMGLAICRTIVEAHQGRLWAEACQSGGAVFHVSLPAAPAR